MKTTSSFLAALLASSFSSALPHGDTKRDALPREAWDQSENICAAIEVLSAYEYQTPPKTGGIKPAPNIKTINKRRAPLEEDQLRAAIELLSSYEYHDQPRPPVKGSVRGPVKLQPDYLNPRSIRLEEEEGLKSAIELLSKVEYQGGTTPAFDFKPPARYHDYHTSQKRAIKEDYSNADREQIKVAIDFLSKYEYKDGKYLIPLPIPIKPLPDYNPPPIIPKPGSDYVRPPPLPWKPQTYPKEKRGDYVNIDSKAQDSIRAAIELLSAYEYKDGPNPYYPPVHIAPPIQTLKPVKPPVYEPAPYTPKIGKRDAPSEEEENLRAAIEVLSRVEYKNQARDLEDEKTK